MKKYISSLTLIAAVILTSCGGGTLDSKYFGKAPGVLNKNLEKLIELSDKEPSNQSEYEKINKQIKAFSSEIKEAMPDPFVETDIETEVSADLPYEVTKATIVSGYVSSGNYIGALRYKIEMSVSTTDEMLLPKTVNDLWLKHNGQSARGRAYENIFFKFVDNKGEIIDQDKRYAIGDNRYKREGTRFNSRKVEIETINLPAGEQIDMVIEYDFGDFTEKELAKNIKKAGLDKIVFITEEEFDKNQEILNQQKSENK